MPTFASKPLGQPHSAVRNARTRPVLYFGLPFIGIIVAGSFALSSLTSTRYELRDSKVTALSKEEELHMDKNRKKIDIREEYFVRLPPLLLAELSSAGPSADSRPHSA